MAKYQPGDIVTYHFIIKEMNGDKIIQAWTDSKEIAKFYLDFHKCKYFRVKSLTKSIEEITKILEENWNDEIRIFNIITKNRTGKHKDEEFITISIPATETEMMFIREESSTFLASRINYGYINEAIPYMKKKYQDVLQSIFLTDVIRKVIYSHKVKFAQSIQFDELMILFRAFPENFGK